MSENLELVAQRVLAQRALADEKFKRFRDKYKTIEDTLEEGCVMPPDLVQTRILITEQYNKNCERSNKTMATYNLVQWMITEQYNKTMVVSKHLMVTSANSPGYSNSITLFVCLGVDEEDRPQTLSLDSVARHEVGFGAGHSLKTFVSHHCVVNKWIVTDLSPGRVGRVVATITYDGSEAKLSWET